MNKSNNTILFKSNTIEEYNKWKDFIHKTFDLDTMKRASFSSEERRNGEIAVNHFTRMANWCKLFLGWQRVRRRKSGLVGSNLGHAGGLLLCRICYENENETMRFVYLLYFFYFLFCWDVPNAMTKYSFLIKLSILTPCLATYKENELSANWILSAD